VLVCWRRWNNSATRGRRALITVGDWSATYGRCAERTKPVRRAILVFYENNRKILIHVMEQRYTTVTELKRVVHLYISFAWSDVIQVYSFKAIGPIHVIFVIFYVLQLLCNLSCNFFVSYMKL
jgi:hypothetical protein